MKRNPMNTKTRRELLFGHAILHGWRRNNWKRKPDNWTKGEIVSEHSRLVKIMKSRGYNHKTPMGM